ncbi:hypothetical protein PInf_024414 [Phytophthora infestans]|nr:hypothetical protein PInf_024414 [Phytophthora infestans]
MTAINATGGGTLHNVEVNDEEASQTCLYCANLKVLRDLLPPKRCDYCRKWRCQFCTLKFPLLGARKGLPKKLKGNSRICMQCFGQIWQDNEAANSPDMPRRLGGAAKHVPVADTLGCRRELRGVSFVERDSMIESGRRGSMIDSSRRSSTMGSSRRGSMHETERRESMLVDQVWARSGSFSDTHRYSFMDSSSDNDLAKRPLTSRVRHGGVSYRMASFLGLVAGDGADRTSMNSAIGLWMSLFAASILGSVQAEYKLRLHELKETLAYYLSDECPWKMIKTTKGGDIYEMTANKTPFAIFKIEVLITGISMDRFLDFVDSKDPKDRCLWDLNEANFEVIETFDASDLNEDADKTQSASPVSSIQMCLSVQE